MENFKTYLASTNQTISSFADSLGVSRSFMSEIVSGKKNPSLDMACNIFVATGQKIDMAYWAERLGSAAPSPADHSQVATQTQDFKSGE